MDTVILEDLGLTNAEIKIYLVLLELGSSTAGPILEKTGLQNSVVHMTLHKLVGRGFISFVKKGKIKHYQATDPRNIISFIEEKKEKFEKILPQLIAKQQGKEKQEAEIFEGIKGIKNMYYEQIKNGKKGDEYLFFSFYPKYLDKFDDVFTFYKHFESVREQKGFITRGIIPSNIKDKYMGRDTKTLLFVNFPVPTNISIFQDYIIFISAEEEIIAFLIHSRQLVESFRMYFYSIWDKYKK